MHSRTLSIASALLTLAGAVQADTQNFNVNAQYRGMVKKAFTDIGTGWLSDNGGPTGNVRITGHARVDHPKEEGRVYDMKLDMTFNVKNGTIQEIANASRANPGSEEALKTTQKLLPFVHIAKWIKPDQSTGETYVTPRGTFKMRLSSTERNLEATLYVGHR